MITKAFQAGVAATSLWLIAGTGMGAAANPNILLLLLADDMGYSDPGCYGGEMATPSIDRLAKEGVRLTRFANGGMCVVSRASMLTGNYWARIKKEFPKTPLLSEVLHESGYRTALIGNWHLRGDRMDRGLDHFFGFTNGASDHFSGNRFYRLDREPFNDFGPGYFSADAFTDRAISFIQHPPKEQEGKPFFLYLSYQIPHNPLQAPRADILKQRGKYLAGWQAVREACFKRQKEMGLVPPVATLPAYPQNLPEWKDLSSAQRDLEDLRMSTYAAMVERMDQGIGRVMEAIKTSGEADNTVVLFMSDNGADSFFSVDATLLKKEKLPGDPGSNWQLGTGWAYAGLTPWRLYKISQHGGGITTGAVVWWPGKTGKPGRIENSLVHMLDVLSTFVELAGQQATKLKVEGESFLTLIRGNPGKRKSPLFFQMADNRAIRTAECTMVCVDGGAWELFDTAIDPLEINDLASKKPELVAKLDSQWMEWWQSQSGEAGYKPDSTEGEGGYEPQGDRGTGKPYKPSAMPASLTYRYPVGPKL